MCTGVVNYYADSGSCTEDGQPYTPRARSQSGFTAHVDVAMEDLDDDEDASEAISPSSGLSKRNSNLGNAPLPPAEGRVAM